MSKNLTKLFALISIISIVVCFSSCEAKQSTIQIAFPIQGGQELISELTINYNLNILDNFQKDIGRFSYIYSNPIETDYKIVEKLGFEAKDETTPDDNNVSGIRWFKKNGSLLRIDKYGNFTYSTGAEDTFFEMPLDEKECKRIAKEYISNLGLLDENISSQWSTNQSCITTDGEQKVVGIGINMFVELDGLSVYGDNQITVEVNGNGEVTRVYYSVTRYRTKDKVSILTISDSTKHIDEGNGLFNISNEAKRLNFENVVLSYWDYEDESGKYLIPVYVFEGMSETSDGFVENFTIIVQADK